MDGIEEGVMELWISLVAIFISAGTAWFTIFHRGTVKMTRPHFFALIPEDGPFGGWLKIFMRSLLFSTGKRGRVIENMYITLKSGDHSFSFHYWMFGDTEQLVIGSGVFVGHEGIAANHHFVPTCSFSANALKAGNYEIEVYASLLTDKTPILLSKIRFELGEDEAAALCTSKDKAIFFIWDKESEMYKSRIDVRKPKSRTSSVSGSGSGTFFFG